MMMLPIAEDGLISLGWTLELFLGYFGTDSLVGNFIHYNNLLSILRRQLIRL